MPKRQVILTPAADPAGESDATLGTPAQVIARLARYNTAPDGAPAKSPAPLVVFYGPGFLAEMPTSERDVRQVMVTMTDDDFAFPVLIRLCREQRWTMIDAETGRRFGP